MYQFEISLVSKLRLQNKKIAIESIKVFNQEIDRKMADESLQMPNTQNLDFQIISLFQRLDSMRKDSHVHRIGGRLNSSMKAKHSMQVEIRTLEFWR